MCTCGTMGGRCGQRRHAWGGMEWSGLYPRRSTIHHQKHLFIRAASGDYQKQPKLAFALGGLSSSGTSKHALNEPVALIEDAPKMLMDWAVLILTVQYSVPLTQASTAPVTPSTSSVPASSPPSAMNPATYADYQTSHHSRGTTFNNFTLSIQPQPRAGWT
ncbi:hypothetical protein PENSPDRAFT_264540 [Peniophora sp. CONT]|nr:hypothetical protein PENSPDRAFT_264540 [Peniophora sp. CONT]